MISCEIYEDMDGEDPKFIGSKHRVYPRFKFNSLPKEGDTLWLQYEDTPGKIIQSACIVTFSAQWCSDFVESNTGYIEVKFIKDGNIKDKISEYKNWLEKTIIDSSGDINNGKSYYIQCLDKFKEIICKNKE